MSNIYNNRVSALRELMTVNGIDVYIVPEFDPHLSEYPSKRWLIRGWLSGFTGSAGCIVITHNDALLWCDSRYFIQGELELKGSVFSLKKMGLVDTPSITEWICANIAKGKTVAFCNETTSTKNGYNTTKTLSSCGYNIDNEFNPFNAIWDNRPLNPQNPLSIYSTTYAGEDALSKLSRVKEGVKQSGCNAIVVAPLDDIAWLFNIRGNDVAYNPVVVAFAYISDTEVSIFIDSEKLNDHSRRYFASIGVTIHSYNSIYNYLESLPTNSKVLVDADRCNLKIAQILGSRGICTLAPSPIPMMKGVKNPTEIAGCRDAVITDGVAIVKFLHWLDTNIGKTKITELSAAEELHQFRLDSPLFIGESFNTIVGYASNGAIVHYAATQSSSLELKPCGLFLVDSGGQYLNGTTDITRTIPLGKLTENEIHHFTLVLKGHIAIATAKFPFGTRGCQLDVLARHALWQESLTYLHGTGHGVGHYLNVHEGPQNISTNHNPTPLHAGMITSNEPGLYIAGEYGIRIENLTVVTEFSEGEFGKFLQFETLSLAPIDRRAIEVSILTPSEISWINNYHKTVYSKLSPLLDATTKEWLKYMCSDINNNNN